MSEPDTSPDADANVHAAVEEERQQQQVRAMARAYAMGLPNNSWESTAQETLDCELPDRESPATYPEPCVLWRAHKQDLPSSEAGTNASPPPLQGPTAPAETVLELCNRTG